MLSFLPDDICVEILLFLIRQRGCFEDGVRKELVGADLSWLSEVGLIGKNFQQVFFRNDFFWKHVCIHYFMYWQCGDNWSDVAHEESTFQFYNVQKTGESPWRQIFRKRLQKNANTMPLVGRKFLDKNLVNETVKRIRSSAYGIDVYEYLVEKFFLSSYHETEDAACKSYLLCKPIRETNLTLQHHLKIFLFPLHSEIILNQWKKLISDPKTPLMEGAILLSQIQRYPCALDHCHITNQIVNKEIDKIVDFLNRFRSQPTNTQLFLNVLLELVYKQLGFKGSSDYYDIRNNFIMEVLLRKEGIPITLCTLLAEIARRFQIELVMVPFPCHVFLRTTTKPFIFIDGFHGKLLNEEECIQFFQQNFSESVPHVTSILKSLETTNYSPKQLYIRMLKNIINFNEHNQVNNFLSLLHFNVGCLLEPKDFQMRMNKLQRMISLFPDDCLQDLEYITKNRSLFLHYCGEKQFQELIERFQYILHHKKMTSRTVRTHQAITNEKKLRFKIGQCVYVVRSLSFGPSRFAGVVCFYHAETSKRVAKRNMRYGVLMNPQSHIVPLLTCMEEHLENRRPGKNEVMEMLKNDETGYWFKLFDDLNEVWIPNERTVHFSPEIQRIN